MNDVSKEWRRFIKKSGLNPIDFTQEVFRMAAVLAAGVLLKKGIEKFSLIFPSTDANPKRLVVTFESADAEEQPEQTIQ